jgi:putative membrane protein insertion efficiency factor
MTVSRETASLGGDTADTAVRSGAAASASTVSRETESAEHNCADHALPENTETVSRETVPGPLARLILLPIRGYRRFLSPALGQRCRYYPTCSAYAEEAVRELGPLRGTIVAAWRVLRCNPLSKGGLDPLEDRRPFASREPTHPVRKGARHA